MTAQLARELARSVELPDGTRINGKRYVAGLVRQALQLGQVTLASGMVITLGPEDVLSLLRWVFAQLDGPPPARHEVENSGQLNLVEMTLEQWEQRREEQDQQVLQTLAAFEEDDE
jgi:hypothetical protein